MRMLTLVVCLILAAPAGVSVARAGESVGTAIVTPYTPAYASPDHIGVRLQEAPAPVAGIARSGLALDAVALARANAALDAAASPKPKKKSYLPVLYSLIVPGTGEIALGYPYRGVALVAMEALAWSGYYYYNQKGLDDREAYERFADQHWDFGRWIQQHPATYEMVTFAGYTAPVSFDEFDAYGRTLWSQTIPAPWWPGYHTWHPKSTEKQNYYENIGKYDWFISGWDDWDPDPNLSPRPMDTDLRTQYRGMRIESNDNLDTAEKFIFLSIGARVYSLIETYFLVRSYNDSVETGAAPDTESRRYAFTARSTGVTSGEFALEFRF